MNTYYLVFVRLGMVMYQKSTQKDFVTLLLILIVNFTIAVELSRANRGNLAWVHSHLKILECIHGQMIDHTPIVRILDTKNNSARPNNLVKASTVWQVYENIFFNSCGFFQHGIHLIKLNTKWLPSIVQQHPKNEWSIGYWLTIRREVGIFVIL